MQATGPRVIVPYLLFVAFVVVPLLELSVIIQVQDQIGLVPTIALLVFDSLVGAWLVKREGVRAWRNLTESFQSGGMARSPVDELTQGALVVFGGALLLTPGFVTDVLGLACVLPLTRAPMASMVRRVAATITARRMGAGKASSTGVFMRSGRRRGRSDDGSGRSDGGSGRSGGNQATRRRPVRPTRPGSSGARSSDGDHDAGRGGDEQAPDVEVLGVERDAPE